MIGGCLGECEEEVDADILWIFKRQQCRYRGTEVMCLQKIKRAFVLRVTYWSNRIEESSSKR